MLKLDLIEFDHDFREIIKKIMRDLSSFMVTSEEGNVVILSEKQYEQMMTLIEYLLTKGVLPKVFKENSQSLKKVKYYEGSVPDLFDPFRLQAKVG